MMDKTTLSRRAAGGDFAALDTLLLANHDRLAARIARHLPADLQGELSVEDVLQDTFVEAFRCVKHFEPQGTDAFAKWLTTLADHRLLDAIKKRRRTKRGGAMKRVSAPVLDGETVIQLLEQLQVNPRTPSRSAAGHEAASAIRVAMAGLSDDYREALRMRYLEGLSVGQTAERLGKTEAAVHKLCARALDKLKMALGRTSKFFTVK